MQYKRHTCIICGAKRYEKKMECLKIVKANHWACTSYKCFKRLSDLNGQLQFITDKELFYKIFCEK